MVSIPSSGSIQFLQNTILIVRRNDEKVSIPSSGSIQFLPEMVSKGWKIAKSLNPLKRVNSILTLLEGLVRRFGLFQSQSPQAGQFNSYASSVCSFSKSDLIVSIPSSGSIQFLQQHNTSELTIIRINCLNPLKRVNSILT